MPPANPIPLVILAQLPSMIACFIASISVRDYLLWRMHHPLISSPTNGTITLLTAGGYHGELGNNISGYFRRFPLRMCFLFQEIFLSTVLTGISFAETIVVALGTMFAVALLGKGVETPIAIVFIAMLLLIFAKVIPKTIAAQRPERIALPYGRAIEAITKLLHPLVIVLSWIAESIARMVHSSTMPKALISTEEISTIISIGEE